MRRVRGIIALVVAVAAGLLAARMVGVYINRSSSSAVDATQAQAAPQAPASPEVRIPEGMREIAIRVDEVTGVSRELLPGDIVDVLTITPFADRDTGYVARILFENVTVYRVGGGRTEVVQRLVTQKKSWTVSILLPPALGAVLAAAAQTADIALMIRQTANESAGSDSLTEPVLSSDTREYIFLRQGGLRVRNKADMYPDNRIPENMRAITLKIDETDGVQGVFRPGDQVDVILSSPLGIFNSQGDHVVGASGTLTENRAIAVMLLQDVTVLGAADIVPPEPNRRSRGKRVTLVVTPHDALKLSSALDAGGKKGRIRLVHRRPGDHGRPPTAAVNYTDLLTQRRESKRVTVIKGNQRAIIPFYQ